MSVCGHGRRWTAVSVPLPCPVPTPSLRQLPLLLPPLDDGLPRGKRAISNCMELTSPQANTSSPPSSPSCISGRKGPLPSTSVPSTPASCPLAAFLHLPAASTLLRAHIKGTSGRLPLSLGHSALEALIGQHRFHGFTTTHGVEELYPQAQPLQNSKCTFPTLQPH